ncbi:MAG: hypothetical protein K9M44_03885 [Candidatus Pacebacteria bacterium]|nr:hypothetical protein [Candidatus Paceibacterota bacterium]
MKNFVISLSILLMALTYNSQAQTFFKVYNLTDHGMTVTVEEPQVQMYLASQGSTTAPNFSQQIFSTENLSQVTLRVAYDNKVIKTQASINAGRVDITGDLLRSESSGSSGGNNYSATFTHQERTGVASHKTGHFVKVFNLTGYKLYGMTDHVKGYIFDPGGVSDTTGGSRSYIVSSNLGILYNPLLDQFTDRSGTVITDTTLLSRILNSSMASTSMVTVWLPHEAVNFNLRYPDQVSLDDEQMVKIDLLAVVQRMITPQTSVITITADDLEAYRPRGEPQKRRIQNKTSREFIFELAGEQLVIPPKKGRKMSLSDKFFLPEGAYYIPISIIEKGKMYEFYYLTILNNRTDMYPEINSWDLKDLQIFGQSSLE